MQVFQGKSVFGGIAIGKISVYRKKEQQVRRRSVDDPEAEIGRYAWAREEAIAQLQKLYEKALREIGETNAAIFEMHQLMLEDEAQTVETLAAFSGQDREYVWNCIYDGVMKISMDPCANRVQEFYSAMIANGDISASADPDITGHVDSTIYYDALTEAISRYPDFQPYGEMMDRYAGNNL